MNLLNWAFHRNTKGTMASVKEIYAKLSQEVDTYPDKYVLSTVMCNQLKKLPLEHGDFVQGLINENFVISSRKKQVSIIDLTSNASKKNNTMNTVYKGKTYETGKGPNYISTNIPLKLQKILVAYLNMITE